jgi:transposase
MLVPDPANDTQLQDWITPARDAGLPYVRAFTRGLDLDIRAVTAALRMSFHNGRTERVNARTKMINRQMYGRAGFALRHRILLS